MKLSNLKVADVPLDFGRNPQLAEFGGVYFSLLYERVQLDFLADETLGTEH